MEACSGSHFWARKFRSFGHDVVLIAPQFVKPYVKRDKTDAADAEAICEAASRETMRFVPIKQAWHHYLQLFHRIRERLIRCRTALCNEIRGFYWHMDAKLEPVGHATMYFVGREIGFGISLTDFPCSMTTGSRYSMPLADSVNL